jgi:hypothetical protein
MGTSLKRVHEMLGQHPVGMQNPFFPDLYIAIGGSFLSGEKKDRNIRVMNML